MIDYEATLAAMRLGATVSLYEHVSNKTGRITQMKFVLVAPYPESTTLLQLSIERSEDVARWALWLGYRSNGKFSYRHNNNPFIPEALAFYAYKIGKEDAPMIAAALERGDPLPEYLS